MQNEESRKREECNLTERLHALGADFHCQHDLEIQLQLDPSYLRFSENVCNILIECVRELLTFAQSRTEVRRVVVSSALPENGYVALTVRIDGAGLATRQAFQLVRNGGAGLEMIASNLHEGHPYIELESDAGLLVTISLPVSALEVA